MEHTVGTDYYHRGRIDLRRKGEQGRGEGKGGKGTGSGEEGKRRNCSHDSQTQVKESEGRNREECSTKNNGFAAGWLKPVNNLCPDYTNGARASNEPLAADLIHRN